MINNVNLVAVIVAAVVSMVIGAIWYSPKVFGGEWMKSGGGGHGDMKKAYFWTFIGTLVTAYVLSYFIGHPGMANVGASVGFWAWLGFMAPVELGAVVWGNKPMKHFWVCAGHSLVSLVVMGSILAVWG